MFCEFVTSKLRRTRMQEVVTWFDTNVTQSAWKTGYNHEILARIDEIEAEICTQKVPIKN